MGQITLQPATLLADAGGTKTNWALLSQGVETCMFSTTGINPSYCSQTDVLHILNSELLPALPTNTQVTHINFFGAGCALPEKQMWVSTLLQQVFPQATVLVESDLLGAAHALLANHDGIACILGTGCNAGVYNGREITHTPVSLGFWLGDEGGGGWIGKTLLQHYFHGRLPKNVENDFGSLELGEALENLYKRPMPNAYAGRYAPIAYQHRHEPTIKAILAQGFTQFVDIYIKPLYRPGYEIAITGSIAQNFTAELEAVFSTKGLPKPVINNDVIGGLVKYYS